MHLSINKKKIYFYLLTLFFLSTIINVNYNKYLNEFFKLKNIDIYGLKIEDKKKVLNEIIVLKYKNIFLVNNIKISNILNKFEKFESYKIQKIFPNKLKIYINETKYIARTVRNGKEFIVGQNKKFININNFNYDLDLPIIFGEFPIDSFIALQKNLREINLDQIKINEYYYFKSGRWDLKFQNKKILKLPIKNQLHALKKYKMLNMENKFNENNIIDFRISDRIIISNEK